jgi:hypothetical protein
MAKRKFDHIADRVHSAEMQYQRMMDNINKGIVNREEIVAAMDIINMAHQVALHEKRRELVK